MDTMIIPDNEEKIGQWLVKAGAMSEKDVQAVLKEQKNGNDSLFGIIAMENGFIDPEILLTYAELKGI